MKVNNLTVLKAAELLQVTRPTLSNILNCKAAITPNMAIRIEKVFGGNAVLWLKLQATYDLRKAEKEFANSAINLHKFQFV
ncbi:MAG: addiction module antidote protein, HigA family [Flavobacterium sp.]|nr:MAG: addiction module antidote protein, HigA family [Flavobacterium sp.]